MGCDTVDENSKWFWGLGAGVLIFMSMPLWKKNADTKSGCGCGCKGGDCAEKNAEARVTRGEEVFNSEMNQDVSGPSAELNRINPVEVGGAEDVYGAESFNTEYVNMNPLDFQTPTSFSQVSGYTSQPFWDQANDMLPEYRYAMPWSSSYLPVNEWRPNDQQGWPAGPLPFDPRTR
ncbi:MAG TPA: hypothetical protein DHN29_07755 [Cytophagales bacterium]|nr:hypothetical protein [Cytophagales bacterium]